MTVAKKSKPKNPDAGIREQVITLLDSGNAHVTLNDAIKGLPANLRGVRPEGMPYSAWELLEHIRIAQWDIVDFSVNPKYKAMGWPKDYWPKSPEPPSSAAWEKSVKQIRKDREEMIALLKNPKTDLLAKIPWGDGQTILREALLIADHNAYHIGELVAVRRALGAWK